MMQHVEYLHPEHIGKVVKIRLIPRASTGTGELGTPDHSRAEDFVGVLGSYIESKKDMIIQLEGMQQAIRINPNRNFVDLSVRTDAA